MKQGNLVTINAGAFKGLNGKIIEFKVGKKQTDVLVRFSKRYKPGFEKPQQQELWFTPEELDVHQEEAEAYVKAN